MNNKKIGTRWEKEFCNLLASKGYWVHFITPNIAGQQPFDIIAVKDNEPIAIDCKTSAKPIFNISRLQDNQVNAFELWLACGNESCGLAIKYNNKVYYVPYTVLRLHEKIDLRDWKELNL